jgi:AcrR family transcriptional regulator
MALTNRITYRHGNLPAAALDAAVQLIGEVGISGFTVRGVADTLGVSHRALYRHFTDTTAILTGVAGRGFLMLAEKLKDSPTREAYVENYIHFALANLELYRVMMSRTQTMIAQTPGLALAVTQVTEHALTILTSSTSDPTTRKRNVMKIWMALHGAITLHSAGILQARSTDALIAEIKHILGPLSDQARSA